MWYLLYSNLSKIHVQDGFRAQHSEMRKKQISLDGSDVGRRKHLIQRLHHMTHSHQSCCRRVGARVLANLRCPATYVQTSSSVPRQSSHLSEDGDTELNVSEFTTSSGERAPRSSYLSGHQLQSVLLERLHLVQPGHDDLLQLLEAVRLERHPSQTLKQGNNCLLVNKDSAPVQKIRSAKTELKHFFICRTLVNEKYN